MQVSRTHLVRVAARITLRVVLALLALAVAIVVVSFYVAQL
jgi:hypothetical protein